MGQNRNVGNAFEQRDVTADFTTDFNVDQYNISAPNGMPVTVTLDPNVKDGDEVQLVDAAGNAAGQPITIDTQAERPINGLGTSTTISANNGSLALRFSAELQKWNVINATSAVSSAVEQNYLQTQPIAQGLAASGVIFNPPSPGGFPFTTITGYVKVTWNVSGACSIAGTQVQLNSTLDGSDVGAEGKAVSGPGADGSHTLTMGASFFLVTTPGEHLFEVAWNAVGGTFSPTQEGNLLLEDLLPPQNP